MTIPKQAVEAKGRWFQPYFTEWLVQKYFSWWTRVLCVGIVGIAIWWLS